MGDPITSSRPPATRPHRRGRRAAALIELALALPVLLMLALGACEYGYFVYAKTCMQGAARGGARAAILSDADNAKVDQAVQRSLQVVGLHNTGYVVTTDPPNVSGIPTGTAVTVTVTCDWERVGVRPLPAWLGGIPAGKQVKGAAVMNRE